MEKILSKSLSLVDMKEMLKLVKAYHLEDKSIEEVTEFYLAHKDDMNAEVASDYDNYK